MSRYVRLVAILLAGTAALAIRPAAAGSPLTEGPSPTWGYGYEVPAYAYAYGYPAYQDGVPVYAVFGYAAPEYLVETSPFLYFAPRVRLVRVGPRGKPKAYVPDLDRSRAP